MTKTPHVECFNSGSTDGITDGWVGANTVRRVVRLTNKISFPTCQVRVVRFYQNCCPPPPPLPPPPPHLLLLRLLLAIQIPVGTAAPPPRAPDPSGHCRTPTASCRSLWAQPDLHRELQIPVALPDPNRELHIAVGTAGPQPRLPGRSGHCRTSTASSRSQWALPDLNRDFPIAVGTAGPQREEKMSDRMSKDMPDRMPEKMSEKMSENMPDRMLKNMPQRMSEDMADRMSEDMPEKMSEDMPDKMSNRMPEDMPDRMPEDFPDRMSEDMPEDMPDRMPEDLPDTSTVLKSHQAGKVTSSPWHGGDTEKSHQVVESHIRQEESPWHSLFHRYLET